MVKTQKNEFIQAVYDIRKLAMERMRKQERKKFQDEEDKKRGKLARKNPKIPYNIYQGILRKEKEIKESEKKDALLSREATYFNPVVKRNKKVNKWGKGARSPGQGKYKNGTLFIKKSDLAQSHK